MSRLQRAALLTVLLTTLAVAPAGAVKTRTDTVTASVHKTGRSGTAFVYKGTVHSKVFGEGKVVEKLYGNLKGTFVITYAHGKVRGASTAHAKAAPGGGVNVTGTYRLTGGTGRYDKISGSGTFTGHSDTTLQKATFRQHGKVTY